MFLFLSKFYHFLAPANWRREGVRRISSELRLRILIRFLETPTGFTLSQRSGEFWQTQTADLEVNLLQLNILTSEKGGKKLRYLILKI